MEPRLTGINRQEALCYLGYRGGGVPPEVSAAIDRCTALLLETARPRIVWRQFDLAPDGTCSAFRPQGDDIAALLRGCDAVVLLGATLGAETERLLRQAQVRNMADAVILDSCASCAIENVCDNFCADLQASLETGYLTDRFSPGYGDLPIGQQAEIANLLDLERRIGVHLSPGGMLIPQKSVIALLGIAAVPQTKRHRGCAACNLFETCSYRKENQTCEQG